MAADEEQEEAAAPAEQTAAKADSEQAATEAKADEVAAEEKPKRAPRSAKKADAEKPEAAAEEKPKRTRAKKAEAAEAEAAEAEAAEDEAPAEEKPKRTRAKRGEKADKGETEQKPETSEEQPKRTRVKRPSAESSPAPRAAAAGSRTVVRAQARYVRTSARKARMVCGHLRGKSVSEARAILAFTPRAVARDWSKLLESAVANAENNHELVEEDLVVREAYADEGPTIKRFRPRARGRAAPIRKRTSHLTITLSPGD